MKIVSDSNNLVEQILISKPEWFSEVMKNADKHRLQILYTQIDRDENNRPSFTSHHYRTNATDYFYPASTVKMPAAFLALEKLNNLNTEGLNKFTPLRIDSAFSSQSRVTADSTSENGLPSIAHYIKKIFLVSDNDAFNRLFEFLGQQYLNETLWRKGFENTKIIRRLESGMSPEENRATNPFTFYDGETIIYEQPPAKNERIYKIEMRDVRQGKGYIRSGELVEEPIDFSNSNYISIENLQGILKAIIFPEAVPEQQRFNLSEDDYRFLYQYMSMLPRESTYPAYSDTSKYYDSYVKYFLFGDNREPIPNRIKIFNKVGQAYGYLIDCAYIIDFENKVEFLLSAVIQVNENQIYNDNVYEYNEIGIPFLANLGRVIYEYERKRERKHLPDLSKFKWNTD